MIQPFHSELQLYALYLIIPVLMFVLSIGESYEEFSKKFPDTVKGHDDWIEWSYLVKESVL